MDKLIEIKTVEEFEKAKAGKTIFMFTANWCPDCMFVKPFIGDIVDAEIGRFVSKLRKTKDEIQAFIDSLK